MFDFCSRYIVGEVSSPNTKRTLDASDILQWISKTVDQIHGDFGFAAVRPGLSGVHACSVLC